MEIREIIKPPPNFVNHLFTENNTHNIQGCALTY